MAIPKGRRFAIPVDDAFRHGLILAGESPSGSECSSQEDESAGGLVRQRIDILPGDVARQVFGREFSSRRPLSVQAEEDRARHRLRDGYSWRTDRDGAR
ncbi:MAG TPA: hypothetical protein VHX38_05640 [Pseudonocardiaceae bacterium]|jgi:hypothetical protein|nr:hypothetical protein [Pseudonocardiaceae bacterium]